MIHLIQRQYLHVAVNGIESAGLALQRSLPDLCRNRLTPAIEQVLEQYAPTDGHLYIERLEIDAGTLRPERLEQNLADLVAQALEKSLREQIPPSDAAPKITAGNIQHKTTQQTVDEALLYFLTTGSLPWSFQLTEAGSFERVILDSWQEAAESGVSPRFLKARLCPALASTTVRQRLIRQFTPVLLETLLSLLASEDKKVVDGILRVLRSSSVASVEAKYFEKQLWETVFAQIAADSILSERSLVREAWYHPAASAVQSTVLASVLERYWPGATRKAPPFLTAVRRLNNTEPIPLNNTEPITPNTVEPMAPNSAEPTPPNSAEPVPSKNLESIPPSLAISQKTSIDINGYPEAGESVYIENAGLVLLHPFLPQFFTTLDIAAEDRLLQPERALCLLHFLTTGQTSPIPEYELVLPKVLCNILLATPVESKLEPSDLEKEEATALLEAVIQHWAVLRSTSPDGLRGTFLLRPGKVSLRDDGDWLLQVESSSFDILLDQLPWGISMIKLPWMKTMLWVEWR